MRRTDADLKKRSHFRSVNRTFALNGGWFFSTREGECGPFRTQALAEKEILSYIRDVQDLQRFQVSRKAAVIEELPKSPERTVIASRDQAAPRVDLELDFSLD